MPYDVTCFDEEGQPYQTVISASDDDEAREMYRHCRLSNRTFHDWRMWKCDYWGRRILVAANEG